MAVCNEVCVTIKWSGKEYSIDKLLPTDTVGYLKEVIKEKTGVLPERQKLLGLKYKGKKKVSRYGQSNADQVGIETCKL